MKKQPERLEVQVKIDAPNMQIVEVTIVGTTPFVQCRFSEKAQDAIEQGAKEGSRTRSKRTRKVKDFDQEYKDAMHVAQDGWVGHPASAFRNAAISACRLVGFKMTHAKLGIFILPDGFDKIDGTPLVRIHGTPRKHVGPVRNKFTGGFNLSSRPMWEKWTMRPRVQYDGDMFSQADVLNLIARIGVQVGIGEGRHDSKESAGVGWGCFTFEQPAERTRKKKEEE